MNETQTDRCPDAGPPAQRGVSPPQHSIRVTVSDPMGLHLRSGRDVVRTASRFESHITAQNLSQDSAIVDVKSILQLMQLQARNGHVLLICADGPDACAALEALVSLF